MGMLGLGSIILVFVLIIAKGVAVIRLKKDAHSLLALGFLAGALGFMAHNVIDFEWYMASAGMVFWLLTASVFVCARLAMDADGVVVKATEWDLKRPVGGFVGAVVLIGMVVQIGVLVSAVAAVSFYSQARVLHQQNRIDSAISSLKNAVQLDPLDASYKNRLGQLYLLRATSLELSELRNVLLEEAVRQGQQAVKLRPCWADYHAQLGSAYFHSDAHEKALMEFRKSEQLYPKKPHYKVLIGEFYLYREAYSKAEVAFERALSLQKYYTVWYPEFVNQDFERAHVGLGTVYLKQQKFMQAEEQFNQALKINPENALAKRWLSKVQDGRQ